MNNRALPIIVVVAVIILGIFGYLWARNPGTGTVPIITTSTSGGNNTTTPPIVNPTPTPNSTSTSGEGGSSDTMIRVTSPTPNQLVTSPIRVTGQARGNWYFEASFPLKVVDANGNQIGVGYAQAQGDWMTENFVPFVGTITFTTSSSATGELVLEKDNPSGLPQNADERRIPIRFNTGNVSSQAVKLYFYNESKDKDASGNVKCSTNGLETVNRTIVRTNTPIQDTLKLLLRGELTSAERARGITTEFPLTGVALRSASLSSGVLTLAFDDPENKTGGGSCRVSILKNQIEATAKQFAGVTQVKFMPADVFQP